MKRRRRSAVIAAFGAAILGFLLWVNSSPQSSQTIDVQNAAITFTRAATERETGGSPNPTRAIPFRDRSAEPLAFRVLDLVTRRPVAGVSVCRNDSGADVCSEHPTDAEGSGRMILPNGLVPPCEIYLALPKALGGNVMRALFPKAPDTDIIIPLYARLVVETSIPHLLSKEDEGKTQIGNLWCVTWPAPQGVFKKELAETESSRLKSYYSMMKINSHQKETAGAAEYHDLISSFTGFDASKLVCLREEVETGSKHTFDVAFAGDVLISYYIPSFDWCSKVRVQSVPGETQRIVLDGLDGRRIRLFVEDEGGKAVAGAAVVIVTRWDLDPGAPHPNHVFFTFTPQGSDRRIAVRRRWITSDGNGEVNTWMFGRGHGEIYAAATKPGHISAGLDLWSGMGVPTKDTYRIQLKQAKPEWASLILDGLPLSNCKNIKVTDLKPTSLLGQIDYPVFSSDEAGKVRFEQLVVGHRYAIMVFSTSGVLQREFQWVPDLVIQF